MRYKARYLSTAKYDRDAIRNYLNQYSLTAATRLFEKIKAKVELAKDNPYMYAAYERRPQFRRIVAEDYLVFYMVNENEKTIEIHHIFRGNIDIEQFI